MEFIKKYIPNVARDRKATEFRELMQGQKMVVDYEAKFTELSRYAPQVIKN